MQLQAKAEARVREVLGDTDKEAEGQRGVSGEAPAGARAPTEATTVGDGVAAVTLPERCEGKSICEFEEAL